MTSKGSNNKQMLGIDWGTSNRRAYLVNAAGACLAAHADHQGLLAAGGDFAGSLAALRAQMGVAAEVPVLMSGMVGSASGWQEVSYLDTSVPLAALPASLAPVSGHPGCWIVPGYCRRDDGTDVMRGEETQLLGAMALGLGEGWLVLPGTHSKWVHLQHGKVARLDSYMTGELFAMLAAGGTLAGLMKDGEHDETAFKAGIDEAMLGKPLSNTLFGVRAKVVTKTMPAAMASSWVSGLLIGAEFEAARRQSGNAIHLIASAALSQRYASAAAHCGMTAHSLDSDQVYLAALGRFFERVSA